nr:twin-arginine translocase TatA/TatE family subunit [uncultured Ruminococcus sp.]
MGIGIPELIVILLVVFLFVGPKKLPEVGESLGKAMKSFKKAVYSSYDEKPKEDSAEHAETETPAQSKTQEQSE